MHLTYIIVKWLTVLLHIPELAGSNLDLERAILNEIFLL
jgi:hypothetical protein